MFITLTKQPGICQEFILNSNKFCPMKFLLNILFPILIFFISLNCFSQTSTNQDNLIYFTTIASQIRDATPKMQGLWGQLQQSLVTAGGNKNQQLDKGSLQSLKNASSENINDLERKLRTLNALHETDTELNLKQSVIMLFTEAKTIQEKAVPTILLLLETGLGKINAQQTTTLKSFLAKGQELRNKSRNIESLLYTYRAKHNLSEEALTRFGL